MPLLIIFMAIIFIIIAIKQNKSPKKLGEKGERKVNNYIERNIKDEKYVINNLTLFIDNSSTQIDHILINKKGVFVIETKNYSGNIYGSEDDYNWTQTLAYGKTKNKFYNPIKQNQTHINFLSKVLKKDDIFKSIIVFPKANLKVKTITPVGNLSIIKDTINNSEIELSKDEINNIYKRLESLKAEGKELEEKHIANIKEREKLRNSNKCPNCKTALVKRKGKHGSFYSCPYYPNCNYIKM